MAKHLILVNNVKKKRTEKGLSRAELACMTASSEKTIAKVEDDILTPSAFLCAQLSVVLDCSFEDLFRLKLEETEKIKKEREM